MLCIFINLPYAHLWNTVVTSGLVQKWICRTVGPSLAASLEPLAHRQNAASLSLFNRYYFGRCSLKTAQLVPLPFSWERSTRYSDRLHDFSVTISRYYKDVYVNSFLICTARLWNSLPIECFPLIYDLNGFKSRINRHLFLRRFPACFNIFVLLFSVVPCLFFAWSESQFKKKNSISVFINSWTKTE